MAPRGSLKRRLARVDAEEAVPVAKARARVGADYRAVCVGGPLRRRLERVAAELGDAADEGQPLTKSLRKHWASGQLSSPLVQELASGAELQGASGVSSLATAGTSGKHLQNLQRSMLNMFGVPPAAADFTWVRIPLARGMGMHPVSSAWVSRPHLSQCSHCVVEAYSRARWCSC